MLYVDIYVSIRKVCFDYILSERRRRWERPHSIQSYREKKRTLRAFREHELLCVLEFDKRISI